MMGSVPLPLKCAEKGSTQFISGKAPKGVPVALDAAGAWILPGFMDVHVHVDDVIAGCELADDWRSASEIALSNGITSLFSFITRYPGESQDTVIAAARKKASEKSLCDYGWHLTPQLDQPLFCAQSS